MRVRPHVSKFLYWREDNKLSYDDLIKLARLCAFHAQAASNREVAKELWKMAREYQEKAAKLNSGKVPDIEKPADV